MLCVCEAKKIVKPKIDDNDDDDDDTRKKEK